MVRETLNVGGPTSGLLGFRAWGVGFRVQSLGFRV